MATKVVALLGNWLSGKNLLAATGAVGLFFRCSPVARLKWFSLYCKCSLTSQVLLFAALDSHQPGMPWLLALVEVLEHSNCVQLYKSSARWHRLLL